MSKERWRPKGLWVGIVEKKLRAELKQIMRRPEGKVSSRFVWDLVSKRIKSNFNFRKLGVQSRYEIWETLCCEFEIFEHEGVPDPQERMAV